jgi:hypothetical protein
MPSAAKKSASEVLVSRVKDVKLKQESRNILLTFTNARRTFDRNHPVGAPPSVSQRLFSPFDHYSIRILLGI